MSIVVLFSHLKYSATFGNFAAGNYLVLVHTVSWPYPDILIRCGSRVGQSLPSLPSPAQAQACDWFFNTQLRQLTYLGKYNWMRILRAPSRKPPLTFKFQTFVVWRKEDLEGRAVKRLGFEIGQLGQLSWVPCSSTLCLAIYQRSLIYTWAQGLLNFNSTREGKMVNSVVFLSLCGMDCCIFYLPWIVPFKFYFWFDQP